VGSVVGTPFWAVGHSDVIKMNYAIGIGTLQSKQPEGTLLAHTYSFLSGISLSELKWGFYNPSESGTQESAFIHFTLHDIAGEGLSNFLRLKSGAAIIYMKGPMSDGTLWAKEWMQYKPVANDCKLDFSPTQGFTYTFAGMPIGRMAQTMELMCPDEITINNSDKGVAHANIFGEYLTEFENKWNGIVTANGTKVSTATIHFDVVGDGINDKLKATPPFITEKENSDATIGDGAASVQPWTTNKGDTIADAVKSLWNERFAPRNEDGSLVTDAGSQIEVNFKEWEGMNVIDVRLHERGSTDTVTSIIPICIGDDNNCKMALHRGQLVSIDFGGIINIIAADKVVNEHGAEKGGSQNGNDGITVLNAEGKYVVADESQYKESMAGLPHSAGIAVGGNSSFDGFGQLGTILNKYKSPEFKIEVELPYSFMFTPFEHGGALPDGMEGAVTGAIKYTSGVKLDFYWYTDPSCSTLALVDTISQTFRITQVVHTIGLNGNTTQISLSQLMLSTKA
jgi:hypothetical protein